MKEIGRLREMAFRVIGEGTGKAADIDAFDAHYHHLFLWNQEEKEIVGAYRLGFSDVIVRSCGLKGLYTRTLFDFKTAFLEKISPAIELGRSFIRPEYQKNYHSLMLLWKGIGKVVHYNPQYKILFGPVSISNEYHTLSRHMIISYMKANHYDTDLGRLIKPRNLLKKPVFTGKMLKTAIMTLEDVQELSELISEIGKDQKGIPILFKQYMKLGGEFWDSIWILISAVYRTPWF